MSLFKIKYPKLAESTEQLLMILLATIDATNSDWTKVNGVKPDKAIKWYVFPLEKRDLAELLTQQPIAKAMQ